MDAEEEETRRAGTIPEENPNALGGWGGFGEEGDFIGPFPWKFLSAEMRSKKDKEKDKEGREREGKKSGRNGNGNGSPARSNQAAYNNFNSSLAPSHTSSAPNAMNMAPAPPSSVVVCDPSGRNVVCISISENEITRLKQVSGRPCSSRQRLTFIK